MFELKSIVSVMSAAVLCLAAVGAAHADTIVCPVEADTYVLHGGMTSNGYPTANAVRAWNWVGSEGLVRFDLSGIQDWNNDSVINGSDVASAVFRFYTHDCTGMMCQPMAPAGTTQIANVTPIAVWADPANHGGHATWTESIAYDEGYIDGDNDPGDVGGVTPTLLSYDLGPGCWGEVDITSLVRSWLNGDYENNGLRIVGADDYGWGWSSKDWNGDDAGGSGDPALTHYLSVTGETAVPEPATCTLLAVGGLLMTALRRRRRQ